MLRTNRVAATLMACLAMLILSACTATPVTAPAAPSSDAASLRGELIVYAAASLTDAFSEAAAAFQAEHPGVTITHNFAGSQQLAQQLGQGAPADLFVSANQRQMDAVVEAGRAISGAAQTLVKNRLVVIYPQDNPAQLTSLHDLATPGIKLVLAAPEVPVGGYSRDFLDKAAADAAFGAAYREAVLANVVSYEENVRSVLSKVALGEADAGIVYTSDVAGADQVGQIDIPDALNTLATYPVAVVADSRRPELAQAYVEFLLSAEGQAILARYGFIPADATTP